MNRRQAMQTGLAATIGAAIEPDARVIGGAGKITVSTTQQGR